MLRRDRLAEEQRKCEAEGKYVGKKGKRRVEAEAAKNRLAELRQQQEMKEVEGLKSEQLSRKLELEQAHLAEFNEFNQEWDTNMHNYEAKAQEDEAALVARQQQEYEQTTAAVQHKLPERPKLRAEVLNLKKIQLNLAKQKE